MPKWLLTFSAITGNSPLLDQWTSKRIIDKPPEHLRFLNWAHWNFPISDNATNIGPDYYANLEKAGKPITFLIRRFIRGERVPIFVGIPCFNLGLLDEIREKAQASRGPCRSASVRSGLN